MAAIARVFVRKNKYTPDDGDVYFSAPDLFTKNSYDEVHVSCLFTWDKPAAEKLAEQWGAVCKNVKIGGPAYDDAGGEFIPGMYVRKGYVQTSRGCPNKCPFCFVPTREGPLRELEIKNGQWIMDNNLLACSRGHIERVFEMLKDKRDIKFLGGLEAELINDFNLNLLSGVMNRTTLLYLAYDMPADKEKVSVAIDKLRAAGFKQSQIWCFVLCGFGNDTPSRAVERCEWVIQRGGIPFASYYRPPDATSAKRPKEWGEVLRWWSHIPVIISRVRRLGLVNYPQFDNKNYLKRSS